jgi:hypothetical protein
LPSDYDAGEQDADLSDKGRDALFGPENGGQHYPSSEVAEKADCEWKQLTAVQEQRIDGKDDFRKNDSMFIVLKPKDSNIERLIGVEEKNSAPIVPDRQRIVVTDNAVYGLKPAERQPGREDKQ